MVDNRFVASASMVMAAALAVGLWLATPGPTPAYSVPGRIATPVHVPAPLPPGVLGVASWYADKLRPAGALYAAMPRYRRGGPAQKVMACAGSRCVTVPVVDFCQCHVGTPDERLIDLSPAAFSRLAPLSVGLIEVSLTRCGRVLPGVFYYQ